MELISAVVPCYNEEAAIGSFYGEMCRVAAQMTGVRFEFVFVDDGSRDKTLEIIKKLRADDKRVKYISFSRNFGKEAAIYAGLSNAAGDWVAVMDADLQDPPALLSEMYRSVTEEGFDIVGSRRVTRKGEPALRSFFARRFYKLMNRFSTTEVVDGARDFQLLSRRVVNSILSMKEYNRFTKGIYGWVGYKKKFLEFENVERVGGETKWNFWGLTKYALNGIIAFSTAPLMLALILFFVFGAASLGFLIWGILAHGTLQLVCALVSFIGAAQLLCIWVLSQYVSKTYLEAKNRPPYIINISELSD